MIANIRKTDKKLYNLDQGLLKMMDQEAREDLVVIIQDKAQINQHNNKKMDLIVL
jgi:hypothetical protein